MTTPLVSIITPCGPRHAEHVRVAAASVRAQSLAPLCEHIIAADGGAEVAPLPGVTTLASDGERHGPAWARNRALEHARGAFILPLDADDYLLPNSVAHLLRHYATGQYGYIYGDAYTLERDGRYVLRAAPDYVQDHMRRHNIHVVTALIPTQAARRVGGYDEGVDAWEDWAFHLRLAIAGICGKRLPIPIFTYRVYEGDRMQRFYGGAREHMDRVLERYQNKEGYIPMASCCGGDATLAQLASNAVQSAPLAAAAPMDGGRVRVEYLGEERGSITWHFGPGDEIKLGNNPTHRYADVTKDQAAWLAERVSIRVVPQFDGPDAPKPLTPIVTAADVLTPDAQALKALRP